MAACVILVSFLFVLASALGILPYWKNLRIYAAATDTAPICAAPIKPAPNDLAPTDLAPIDPDPGREPEIRPLNPTTSPPKRVGESQW